MNRIEFLQQFNGTRQRNVSPMSGLNPYTGPWTKVQAMHLLRRSLFGVKKSDLDTAVSAGMNATVNSLLNFSLDPIPSPPLNIYSTTAEPDPTTPSGQTWVNAPAINAIPAQYYQSRKDTLKMWWTGNLINQKSTLVEKMTLFWYNHFSIELDQIPIAQPVYYYYKMIRENCLGDFRQMLRKVSVDPSMLLYLNGNSNGKSAPDENFGRELQELFTMGKGTDSKYTEDDVKAAAKILTGFRINPLVTPVSYYFDSNVHDQTNKTFSPFYNNKTINGKLFAAGEQELDELLAMLTGNIECARFLCRKLYQYFVYYEITADAETNVIRPLADLLMSSGYNIKTTVEKLLKSEHFFDQANLGCVIKNPLDYAIGLFKEFSVQLPNASNLVNQYYSWAGVTILSAYQGLNIADPPVVSGYQAWFQFPQYHEIWINADTFASRNNVSASLFSPEGLDVNGIKYALEPFTFTKSLAQPGNATELVNDAVSRLYNYPLSTAAKDYLKSFLISGLPNEDYWTDIWNNYIADPTNPATISAAVTRLNALYKEIVSQAEYHLS
ncbi:MAG: DUF1800 domain-containing protein [Saprospiraceae bacterium]